MKSNQKRYETLEKRRKFRFKDKLKDNRVRKNIGHRDKDMDIGNNIDDFWKQSYR